MSWRHGTRYAYERKRCRCAACREAKRVDGRRKRDRRRAENRPSYQRELAASRAVKETYRGTCKLCGAATTGCDGPGLAREICAACAPGHYGPIYAAARRGHGPTVDRLFVLFNGVPVRYSEIRDALGITDGRTSGLLNRLVRYGLIVRIGRGLYQLPSQDRTPEPARPEAMSSTHEG